MHAETKGTYRLSSEQEGARVQVMGEPRRWLEWRNKTRNEVMLWAMERGHRSVHVVTPRGEFLALWIFPRPIRVEATGR